MFGWLKPKADNGIPQSRVRGMLNAILDPVMNSVNALSWSDVWGTINHEKMYSSSTTAALKLSAVKCALDIYTGMVGSIPRRMYALEHGTQKKLRSVSTTEHPASRLFSHYFHPELVSDDALSLIIYDTLMDGNCYFVKELDVQGRTARLYYIHPSRVIKGNIFRSQKGQERLTNGRAAAQGELLYRIDSGLSTRDASAEPLLLARSEVVHFKNKVLDAEYHRGSGFIENSKMPLDLYRASEEFGWKFYSKGIATQMFLTTENRLAPDVLSRIEANFTDDPNAPLEDIFRTRVLEQGLKPVHMGIPFQHLQFIETRAFSVEDVGRGLNIPPVLLHSYMGTKAGDVDISKAMASFIQTGIGPLLSRICNQFRTECLPLPSQMLFKFEFEHLYLYRTVLGEFTTALRNLFEIGMIDRSYGADLLGMHIDPNDPANKLRYLPVNLMTVDHSLSLAAGAELSNEMLGKQVEAQQQSNDGMISGEEHAALQGKVEKMSQAKAEPPNGDNQDKTPSQDNIDKRLRNATNKAFMNVINGLKQYETRALAQKKKSRADDFDVAKNEFYAADGKFDKMLNKQLTDWKGFFKLTSTTDEPIDHLIKNWLKNQNISEGIENEITCLEP